LRDGPGTTCCRFGAGTWGMRHSPPRGPVPARRAVTGCLRNRPRGRRSCSCVPGGGITLGDVLQTACLILAVRYGQRVLAAELLLWRCHPAGTGPGVGVGPQEDLQ